MVAEGRKVGHVNKVKASTSGVTLEKFFENEVVNGKC